MPDTVTVPSVLKGHAAEIWRSAFLASYDGTCKDRSDRDACAASIAWSAVKSKYRKNDQGEWVARAGQPPWLKGKKDEKATGNGKDQASAQQNPKDGEQPTDGQSQDGTEDGNQDPRHSQEWRDAFAAALLGECVKTDDPVGCALDTADNAISGDQQDQQDQTDQQKQEQGQPTAQKGAPQEKPMEQKSYITRRLHRNDFFDLSLPLVIRKDYSPEKRAEFAKKGWALPDGSYPIADREDLMDAIHSFGRAPDAKRAQVKAHIRKRARQLGALKDLSPEWGGEEKSLTARQREAEADADQKMLDAGMATRIARRPDNINSNDWQKRPLQQRTIGYLIQERAVLRSYEEAVERVMDEGWQAISNPTRAEEYIFQRWLDTPDGFLLQRAVLVRRSGTVDWNLREMTRGVALSLAVQIPEGERRFGDPRI